MNFRIKLLRYRIVTLTLTTFLFATVISLSATAQNVIKGKVTLAKDGRPAAFASIKIMNSFIGSISDSSGNFFIQAHGIKQTDTLLVSLIGYENLKVPAAKAASLREFTLQESQNTMESVVVRSFSKEEVAGAKSEIVGYYRSWNTDNTGGEIGRTFLPGHKEYQIAKIRFKVYNTYDTCTIRLHIREVVNGQPGKELLNDSVAQIISRSPIADKPYEFDLNKYNLILKQQNIFVSFQVLNGGQTDNSSRSLSFVGSEAGDYLYKSRVDDNWHSSGDYTIYMKLLLRYDD